MGGDSRTNNNCGGDEAYFFERVHDFGGLVDGTYTIYNNKWSKYLTNNNGDQLSGEETPRNWIVTNEGDGVFSIQDEQSLNYLRCGNQGETMLFPTASLGRDGTLKNKMMEATALLTDNLTNMSECTSKVATTKLTNKVIVLVGKDILFKESEKLM